MLQTTCEANLTNRISGWEICVARPDGSATHVERTYTRRPHKHTDICSVSDIIRPSRTPATGRRDKLTTCPSNIQIHLHQRLLLHRIFPAAPPRRLAQNVESVETCLSERSGQLPLGEPPPPATTPRRACQEPNLWATRRNSPQREGGQLISATRRPRGHLHVQETVKARRTVTSATSALMLNQSDDAYRS